MPLDKYDKPEETSRRKELGAFLRARRAALAPTPDSVRYGRRRVKGLRREEVAERAGIGVAWYTWLEQGRSIKASSGTLRNIARALELKDQEERYLLSIAENPSPSENPTQGSISCSLLQILDSLNPSPALLLNECWDVLGANAAAETLFELRADRGEAQSNMIWRLFHDPQWTRLHQDWERYARCSVAHLRANVMSRPTMRSRRLVENLVRTSTQFRAWWESHEVLRPDLNRKRFFKSDAGELQYDLNVLQVETTPNLRVFVYSPVANDPHSEHFDD